MSPRKTPASLLLKIAGAKKTALELLNEVEKDKFNPRWSGIARCDLEQGFIALRRAVENVENKDKNNGLA